MEEVPKEKKVKARRSGQVVNRGENKWLVRIYNGKDLKGNRKYTNHLVRGQKKDAEQWLRAALRRRDLGEPIEQSKETFSAHLDNWLKVKKQTVKPRTLEIYTDITNRILKPALGDKRLSNINASDIQTLYSHLSDKGLGGRTVELVHVTLTNTFRFAAKWELIRKNPMIAVDRPRHTKKEMKAMSADQARAFLKSIEGDPHECLVQFMLVTGCRPGEVLALKWTDINSSNGSVIIQRSIVRQKEGKWFFDDPKTAKGRRTIQLPPKLIKKLSEHKRQQNEKRLLAGSEWHNFDLVFCNDFGKPPNENFICAILRDRLTKAGLPYFTAYEMRHSAATILMGEGMSAKIVSERLGHANINITLEVYSHVLPTMQEEASATLERLLLD